jgi:hypothetical protein
MYLHLTAWNTDNFKLLTRIRGKYLNGFKKNIFCEVWITINCFWRGYFIRLL